jgi:hypothetical protein
MKLGDLSQAAIGQLLLTFVTGQPPTVAVVPVRNSLETLAWSGIWAAVRGDTVQARHIARLAADSLRQEFRSAAPEFINALVAYTRHRWRETVDTLGRIAIAAERGLCEACVGDLSIRMLVALAYDKLDMRDSAAALYERVTRPYVHFTDDHLLAGIPWAFAEHRLIILYAKLGRMADAERHWKLFNEAFTNPDPDVRVWRDDALRALDDARRKHG